MGGFDVGNAVGKFISRSFLRRMEKHDSNFICDNNIGQREIFGGFITYDFFVLTLTGQGVGDLFEKRRWWWGRVIR